MLLYTYGLLYTSIDCIMYLEEVKNKTIEMHEEVEELSASVTSSILLTNSVSETIRNIKELTQLLSNRIKIIPNVTFKAEQVLEAIPPQCKCQHHKFHPESDHLHGHVNCFFLLDL